MLTTANHDGEEPMEVCECSEAHQPRRLVLTGGPGAGKTAVLEMVRRSLCQHVHVLPESASILFGGCYPRDDDKPRQRAAQRAIFHIQRELEVIASAHAPAIVLCDRGTIDRLAYWPGPPEVFWRSTGTTLESELRRYHAVLHLRTPAAAEGYNQQNPLRTEPPATAAEMDDRILAVWQQHPCRYLIESTGEFLDKAARVLDVLRAKMPPCCARHLTPRPRNQGTDTS